MKKLLLILSCSLLILSCTDNKDENAVSHPLTLSATNFTWDTNVRLQKLEIHSDSDWVIESSVNWCSPYKKSGKGRYDLALWVDPNITQESRTGFLTVTSNNTKHIVNIEQPAYSSDTNYVYRLPLVCHVMYNDSTDSTKYIVKGWLAKVLKVVNSIYKYNKTNIQFEMALINENGDTLKEPGIIRHKVSFSNYDCEKFLSEDASNSKYAEYAQNLKRYINLYVYRFTDDNILGISDMAVMPKNYALNGLVSTNAANSITKTDYPFGCCINNKYIYETENDGYYNPYFIAITLGHELGHYIGLLHSFSENGCDDNDYCEDTHSCDYTSYTKNLKLQFDSLSVKYGGDKYVTLDQISTREGCDGIQYVADNIMDYVYCLSDTITGDQRTRFNHVLHYGSLIPGPKLVDISSLSFRATSEVFTPQISNCPSIKPVGTTRSTGIIRFKRK